MTKCVVKECNNKASNKTPNISFHRFPKKTGRDKWISAIRRNRNDSTWLPRKYNVVCSDHFQESDFNVTINGRRQLAAKKYPTKLNQNPIPVTTKHTRPSISDSLTIVEEAGANGPQTVVNFNIAHASMSQTRQIEKTLSQDSSKSTLTSGCRKSQPAKPRVQTRKQQQRKQNTEKTKTAQQLPVQMQSESNLPVAIQAADGSTFTEKELEYFFFRILEKLKSHIKAKSDFKPEFDGSPEIADGMIKVVCRNNETMTWLKEFVTKNLKGSKNRPLTVIVLSDISRIKCGILFQKDKIYYDISERNIQSNFKLFNSWAGVDRWSFEPASQRPEGTYYTVGIPSDLLPLIEERQSCLKYEIGSVKIQVEEVVEGMTRTETEVSERLTRTPTKVDQQVEDERVTSPEAGPSHCAQ